MLLPVYYGISSPLDYLVNSFAVPMILEMAGSAISCGSDLSCLAVFLLRLSQVKWPFTLLHKISLLLGLTVNKTSFLLQLISIVYLSSF